MPPKSIDQLVEELIEREGGYVNNPADRGGATIYGITEAEARATGYAGSMRDFPRSTAGALYRRRYWLAPHFDQVAQRAPRLAAELFDTGVNMGVETASTFLQRALTALNRCGKDYADLKPDGKIGPVTLAALIAFLNKRGPAIGEVVLLRAVECLQGARYIEICERNPSQEVFLHGWLLNRIGQA